jgi:hypothetical protein
MELSLRSLRREQTQWERCRHEVLNGRYFYSHDKFYTRKQLARAQHGGVPLCHLNLRQEGAKDRNMSNDTAKRVVDTYFTTVNNDDVFNRAVTLPFRNVLWSLSEHHMEKI